ncbi:TPA: hypothetical protein ACX336_001618 [Enterococcus faecium]|uniref:hypothetical protein n=1 Tax=Enterococcus faecium TaxID=1352 RepID=UPI000847431A|nr:hypothetical protein [Enterococcus faecium]AOM32893.1 hypothetical protein AL021_00050 [Enterococcus faecium]EKQ3345413.1 hypothetical protein [Enterococcus faecium]EKQ3703271.1 hypothetical protein [Enterococcus faecium]MBG8287232.1 hypothetical protein [Enterococcus faecium]MBG8487970.1 hypothetical protein [Enterococcus faecium]
MNDFHEAVLSIEVEPSLATAYKKAIEDDNSRHWIKNEIKDADGNIVISDIKPVWNGNYCNVDITDGVRGHSKLTITLLSRTLPNLQEQVDWYKRMGAKVISANYKGENQNGNEKN